ncbi:MAG: tRNA uridine-5-carboxymethylaminomethyl(34) synthesis GTPase MnmE, partial [Candidatus Adiutrix sp.]
MIEQISTIAAVATGLISAPVGIVRLSGPNAHNVLQKIFKPQRAQKFSPRKIIFGQIYAPQTGAYLDDVLAVYFPAPHSFTGEDCVEIQGHGGAMVQIVLEAVLASGAQLAAPGEF